MESKRIYHVHLYTPFQGKQDYYFGSKIAIFSALPEDVVGIRYNTYRSCRLQRYANRKCVIQVDELIRHERNGKD